MVSLWSRAFLGSRVESPEDSIDAAVRDAACTMAN